MREARIARILRHIDQPNRSELIWETALEFHRDWSSPIFECWEENLPSLEKNHWKGRSRNILELTEQKEFVFPPTGV